MSGLECPFCAIFNFRRTFPLNQAATFPCRWLFARQSQNGNVSGINSHSWSFKCNYTCGWRFFIHSNWTNAVFCQQWKQKHICVWSYILVLLVYRIISNPQILHYRATQRVQITAKAFTINSRYLVQNKYSHYKQIQNNNMHTSYQINYIKLKVQHQTKCAAVSYLLSPL